MLHLPDRYKTKSTLTTTSFLQFTKLIGGGGSIDVGNLVIVTAVTTTTIATTRILSNILILTVILQLHMTTTYCCAYYLRQQQHKLPIHYHRINQLLYHQKLLFYKKQQQHYTNNNKNDKSFFTTNIRMSSSEHCSSSPEQKATTSEENTTTRSSTGQQQHFRSRSSRRYHHHGCDTLYPYEPPSWCSVPILTNRPIHGRLKLGNFPTPLYEIIIGEGKGCNYNNSNDNNNDNNNSVTTTSSLLYQSFWTILYENNIRLYVKRDDMSGGIELSGNKIRKLEFLFADALHHRFTNNNKNKNNRRKKNTTTTKKKKNDSPMSIPYDSVVTIGGEQSNHCRATAAAARMVGLTPYLILRRSTNRSSPTITTTTTTGQVPSLQLDQDPLLNQYVGNILMNQMVGSTIYTCTKGEYGRFGSNELLSRVGHYLKQYDQRVPYLIPVGGSNGLGTWGYIEAVNEVLHQWEQLHVVVSNDDDDYYNDNEEEEDENDEHDHNNLNEMTNDSMDKIVVDDDDECCEDDDNNDYEDHQPNSPDPTPTLDHIVLACGSGGTAAGVGLGFALYNLDCTNRMNSNNNNNSNDQTSSLSQQQPSQLLSSHDDNETNGNNNKLPGTTKVHAVMVCDDENYFYQHITDIAIEMGLQLNNNPQQQQQVNNDNDSTGTTSTNNRETIEHFIRDHIRMHQGKGLGYGTSTKEELEFIYQFGIDTGIVLDPVYSGKAFYHFIMNVVLPNPKQFQNQNIMFWHTGGTLGLYDKIDQLRNIITPKDNTNQNDVDDDKDYGDDDSGRIKRLDLYGKGIGIDISTPTNTEQTNKIKKNEPL